VNEEVAIKAVILCTKCAGIEENFYVGLEVSGSILLGELTSFINKYEGRQ
jgi:hypothetical protein